MVTASFYRLYEVGRWSEHTTLSPQ